MFFLKVQGEKVWNSVEYGCRLSLILNAQGGSTGELKPKYEWDKVNNEGCEANVRALFNVFNGVYLDKFYKIANCKHAKETWDILQVTHKGTSSLKISKLQMLATKFKNIRMHENQTFFSFYFELNDILNSSFNLGEPIPDSKIVRKILKSLLKRFRPKVTAIEESKVIDSMRVDELVVSIQTYEMTLPNPISLKTLPLRLLRMNKKILKCHMV